MKQLARIISFITNPLLILFPIPFILVTRSGYAHIVAFKWTLFSLIFFFSAGIFVIYEVKHKVFSDMDVSRRNQRPFLFSFIGVITLIYFIGLIILHAPPILFFAVWGVIISVLFASMINKNIKMSIHVATITAVILTLVKLYDLPLIIFIIIPIVAWARMEIKRHTYPEVITGLIFGVVLTLFMYILIKYIYGIAL